MPSTHRHGMAWVDGWMERRRREGVAQSVTRCMHGNDRLTDRPQQCVCIDWLNASWIRITVHGKCTALT